MHTERANLALNILVAAGVLDEGSIHRALAVFDKTVQAIRPMKVRDPMSVEGVMDVNDAKKVAQEMVRKTKEPKTVDAAKRHTMLWSLFGNTNKTPSTNTTKGGLGSARSHLNNITDRPGIVGQFDKMVREGHLLDALQFAWTQRCLWHGRRILANLPNVPEESIRRGAQLIQRSLSKEELVLKPLIETDTYTFYTKLISLRMRKYSDIARKLANVVA